MVTYIKSDQPQAGVTTLGMALALYCASQIINTLVIGEDTIESILSKIPEGMQVPNMIRYYSRKAYNDIQLSEIIKRWTGDIIF